MSHPMVDEESCTIDAHARIKGHYLEGWHLAHYEEETNKGPCARSRQFEVSDQYHFRSSDGVCHSRSKCA